MAKRGMKRGSVCLTKAEQKLLQKFDKAIEQARGGLKKLGLKKVKSRGR